MSQRYALIPGSLVAIVTPMHEDGSLDLDAYRKLIDWHVESGTSAIVAVGTTGESPTVDMDEHSMIVRVTVEHVAGRIPVIAGTGGNSTREAVELTEQARKDGADATLQVVPYYNRPTQEGMYRHFCEVAEKGELPVIVYNVPGRTAADLANDTVRRLAAVPGIVGLKDATGDIARGAELFMGLPEGFAVYSGNDDSALALMAMGGHGVISVTANVAPREMAQMCTMARNGDWAGALAVHRKLIRLHFDLFVEANPIPVKWALSQMGRIAGGIRLPMTPLSEGKQSIVRAALESAGVLN